MDRAASSQEVGELALRAEKPGAHTAAEVRLSISRVFHTVEIAAMTSVAISHQEIAAVKAAKQPLPDG